MTKKVTFKDIENADGEQDRRGEIESFPHDAPGPWEAPNPNLAHAVPAQEPGAYEVAIEQLKELAAFMGNRKDDQITKEFKINPIHVHLVRDLYGRLSAGKEVLLSDGNKEALNLLHKKHIKRSHA